MKKPKVFGHQGDLGDCIAALPTIRAMGGGELVIGFKPGEKRGRESMEGKRFEVIRPLLAAQPYITGVRWSKNFEGVTHDFSDFRHDHILGESLLEWQARHFGVAASTEPWLSGITPRQDMKGRIVVARTSRYWNWQFPWPTIVKAHRDRIVFIGLPDEHKEFQTLVGPVEYLPTADMLEVAEVIAGSDILISNQTAAGWVGLGLGHPLIQEQSPVTRDSMIPRENAQYCLYSAMPNIPGKVTSPISIASKPKTDNPMPGMTICFPFYNGDRDLAKALAEHIRDLGGVENHKCLIVCPDGTDRASIEEPLREAFASVDIHTYRATLEGWPQGPNEMFAEAAMLIDRDPRFGDFLWLESDCAPRVRSWADQIQRAHQAGGMPILGVITNTVHMDTRHISGRHVVGVAVYPKNFASLVPLVRSVAQTSREYRLANQVPMAFDAYFGPYTASRTCETRLIQHLWRAHSFQEMGGVIRAGSVTGPENMVSPEAVLVHGSKDDSLLRIFSRREPAAAVPTESKQGISDQKEKGGDDPSNRACAQKAAQPAAKSKAGTTVPSAVPAKDGVTYPPVLKRGQKHVPMAPELWNRGEDGLPVPPFLPGQAEWKRWNQLMIVFHKDGIKKLRDYARLNLHVNTLRLTAEKIAEQCVLAERKVGKEEWTKNLPGPWFPPVPKAADPDIADLTPPPAVPANDPSLHTHADQSNPAGWQELGASTAAGDDEISPDMKERMLAVRKRVAERKAALA